MRNKHPGTCYRCGWTVDAEAGHFERTTKAHRDKWPVDELPKWLTQHAGCAVKYRDTDIHYLYMPDLDHPQTGGEGTRDQPTSNDRIGDR